MIDYMIGLKIEYVEDVEGIKTLCLSIGNEFFYAVTEDSPIGENYVKGLKKEG